MHGLAKAVAADNTASTAEQLARQQSSMKLDEGAAMAAIERRTAHCTRLGPAAPGTKKAMHLSPQAWLAQFLYAGVRMLESA